MSTTNGALGGKDFLLKRGNGFTAAVTFTAATDKVGATAHGLVDGQKVSFTGVTGPTTVVDATEYFVVNAATDDFEISLTAGGTAIDIDVDGTGTGVETFQIIGGLRSTSLTLNNELIDVTNQSDSQLRTILDQAGIKNMSISGSGVFVDDVMLQLVETDILGGNLRNYRVCYEATPKYYAACFKVTSLERAGDYNNEQTYSISLESSGAITIVRS